MKNQIIRIIPVLFIKNGKIVRSQNFEKFQILGDVINQAKRLNHWDADELIYIDISRDNNYDYNRDDLKIKSMYSITEIINEISKVCQMPLTFGGGIRSVENAVNLIRNGADKIIINELFFSSKEVIKKIIKKLGSQAVTISLDYKNINKKNIVFKSFGKVNTGLNLYDAVKICEHLGVGEILIQNITYDGSGDGFDIPTISHVVNSVNIPVIACSGAGNVNHFFSVAKIKNISGVAAGNIFNFKENAYQLIKNELRKKNIYVR